MGLFSGKKSVQRTRSTSRVPTSSEAQAAELRHRARRRLIGALVLVVAAVIIVPLLFDDVDSPEPAEGLDVLSAGAFAPVPEAPDPELALAPDASEFSVEQSLLPIDDDKRLTEPAESAPTLVDPDAATGAVEPEQAEADRPASSDAQDAKPITEPARQTPPVARDTPARERDQRTDDGSVALALLEGRDPSQASSGSGNQGAAAGQGNFVLQVAAYSTENDAQSRRARLAEAGVTNAYVEKGVVNGKDTFRLRVGSFPSRDAAQAAQARLRALGYDNSMLLNQ